MNQEQIYKPLYKIWEKINERNILNKYNLPELSEDDKSKIYNKIIIAMNNGERYMELYKYKNPYAIKKWLNTEHYIKCNIYEYQINNCIIHDYSDSHYCYISW